MHPTILEALPFIGPDLARFIGAGLVIFLLVHAMKIVRSAYFQAGPQAVVPTPDFSLVNIFEVLVEQLYGLFRMVMGDDARRYTPWLTALFIYVFAMNLLGSLPGFPAPTSAVGINAGLALFVTVWYHREGIKAHGKGYINQFLGPLAAMAPLMFLIEIISHIARPVSLTLRLAGNINGDHIALGIFQEMTHLIIPCVFMGLGLFVALMQAFVFTLLTSIYLRLAISHDH